MIFDKMDKLCRKGRNRGWPGLIGMGSLVRFSRTS